MKSIFLQLTLFSILAAGCSRTAPLQPPGPLQAAPDPATTEAAIMRALSKRGWLVQQRHHGSIDAIYAPRQHKLWVRIAYDQRAVQIYYLGSEGLRESREGNKVFIHARANTWLKNLASDLSVALQEAQFQGQQPAPGPPPPGVSPPGPAAGAPPGSAPPPSGGR